MAKVGVATWCYLNIFFECDCIGEVKSCLRGRQACARRSRLQKALEAGDCIVNENDADSQPLGLLIRSRTSTSNRTDSDYGFAICQAVPQYKSQPSMPPFCEVP